MTIFPRAIAWLSVYHAVQALCRLWRHRRSEQCNKRRSAPAAAGVEAAAAVLPSLWTETARHLSSGATKSQRAVGRGRGRAGGACLRVRHTAERQGEQRQNGEHAHNHPPKRRHGAKHPQW